MDFQEMCIKLFDRDYMMAYRKGWPDIVTTVRVTEDKKGNQILVYYHLNQAQIPVVITKDITDNDDWECINDINERCSIQQFMRMPKAKEFLLAIRDYMNTDKSTIPDSFNDMEFKLRMNEAVPLRILHADFNSGRMMLTDIGYDLIKMCE